MSEMEKTNMKDDRFESDERMFVVPGEEQNAGQPRAQKRLPSVHAWAAGR